jgi:hypothetical protein
MVFEVDSLGSGFNNQDLDRGIFSQAACNNASCCPAPYDDEIEGLWSIFGCCCWVNHVFTFWMLYGVF